MRKTNILFRQHIERGFKNLWKVKSKRRILDEGIPASLETFKHEIVEAVDFVKDPPPPKIEFSFPEPLALKKLKDPSTNSDWHDDKVLLFDGKTKLIEGIPQILTLLKTVSYNGLPTTVQSLVGKMSLGNQDELLKRKIMQCNVWDGTQQKLPKKLDITKPGWNFPREYGVPITKKTINLENQILLLCALATSKHCTYLPRNKFNNPVAQVFVEKEKERYLFSFKGTYSVMAKKPLEPFGLAEETENMPLPDIFPLRHTVDLSRINLYKDHELLIISPECRNPFVHTIGTSHSTIYYWHQPQKIVKGIAACFTFAVAQAHQLYGANVKALQKPICIHGICGDKNHFTVISYQLNTLNLDGSEGLKNQVWIDGPHQLFETCDEDQGVINYNPEVFPKILATFANGIL